MWNDLKYHHELIKIFQQCHSSVYCKIIFTKFIPGAVLDQYWDFSMETLFNPFVPSAPFLYHLEASENLTGLGFHGVEKGCFGNKWVNNNWNWFVLKLCNKTLTCSFYFFSAFLYGYLSYKLVWRFKRDNPTLIFCIFHGLLYSKPQYLLI